MVISVYMYQNFSEIDIKFMCWENVIFEIYFIETTFMYIAHKGSSNATKFHFKIIKQGR